MKVSDIIEKLSFEGASDIHFKSDGNIYYRKNKRIRKLKDEIDVNHINGFLQKNLKKNDFLMINENGFLDKGINIGKNRIRLNIYKSENKLNIAMRILGSKKIDFESFNFSKEVEQAILSDKGLILITGATGSGKSTTLSAIISKIKREKEVHIILIEDPTEYKYENKKSMITQIEIGRDSKDFKTALKGSLRQDPDIIVVGEIRDADSLEIALRAAETGHLVISTLHTNSAAESIERITQMGDSIIQSQIRYQLSITLKLILSQELILREEKIHPIFEILIPNTAIRNMIRQNKIVQIKDTISISKDLGMTTKERYLNNIVNEKESIL